MRKKALNKFAFNFTNSKLVKRFMKMSDRLRIRGKRKDEHSITKSSKEKSLGV